MHLLTVFFLCNIVEDCAGWNATSPTCGGCKKRRAMGAIKRRGTCPKDNDFQSNAFEHPYAHFARSHTCSPAYRVAAAGKMLI